MSGGVGAYTAELAAALAARGRSVAVLTSVDAADADRERPGDGLSDRGALGLAHRGGQVRRLAHEIGAGWVHVQYQAAAYGMHPAINFAPGGWRRAGLRVAWTYHDLLVPYLFPKAGDRLRRWVTDRPATVCDLAIVTNEGRPAATGFVGAAAGLHPHRLEYSARSVGSVEQAARRAQLGHRRRTTC